MSEDVQAVREGYAAFAAGDLEAIRAKLAPDVVWHVPGRSRLAGDYRGVEEVLGYFGKVFEVSSGTFKAELLECGELAPGLVAALVRATGSLPNGEIDTRIVQVFRREGDRTVEVHGFAEDGYAWDEAVGGTISLPDARTADQATRVQA